MVGCGTRQWYVLRLPNFDVRQKVTDMLLYPSHCALTADDKRLVVGVDDEIRIFHVQTGQVLEVIKFRTSSLHMMTSGVYLNHFEMYMDDPSGMSKILQLIDSNRGRLKAKLEHRDKVLCNAVSADETRLTTGCCDRDVYLWDPHSGSLIATLEGHTNGRLFESSATRGQQTCQIRVHNSYSKQC